MDRAALSALLSNQNVAAFLRVIREGESGQADDAYARRYHPTRVIYIDSLIKHPRLFEDLPDGSGRRSSAAGAYQFTATTWDGVNRKYGLDDDFSPASQDLHAVALLDDCGALQHVLDGDFDAAVAAAGDVWASLPDSGLEDGGSKLARARARNVWNRYGGSSEVQEPAPIRDAVPPIYPPAPPAAPPRASDGPPVPTEPPWPYDPAERPSEAPMSPALILALGQTLLSFLPAFGSGSKTSTRNIQMTQELGKVLIDTAKTVVPSAINEQAAVQAIVESRDLQDRFKQAAAVKWDDIAPFIEATEKSRAAARSFMQEMTDGSGPMWRAVGYAAMVGLLALAIVIGGGLIMREVLVTTAPWASVEMKVQIVNYYQNIGLIVVGFVFGSSYSSHRKDVAREERIGG